MTNPIEFDKEYSFDFEIDHDTKNKDHLTSSEILDLVEKITARAKKDLNALFVLGTSVVCNFLHKTKPFGKLTLKYMIQTDAIIFSIFQNDRMTAKGNYKIAKIIY